MNYRIYLQAHIYREFQIVLKSKFDLLGERIFTVQPTEKGKISRMTKVHIDLPSNEINGSNVIDCRNFVHTLNDIDLRLPRISQIRTTSRLLHIKSLH